MKTLGVWLSACFVGGMAAYAQTEPPAIPIAIALSQTQTFGIVGVALNQTVRLNVLNSAGPPLVAGAAVQACKLTLQFLDDQNTKVAELAVDSLDPGKATHLDFVRPGPTATAAPLRVQVRGVVVNTSGGASGVQPGAPTIQVISLCTILPTVEVFDSDTGKTQVVLSGTSFVPGVVTPLM